MNIHFHLLRKLGGLLTATAMLALLLTAVGPASTFEAQAATTASCNGTATVKVTTGSSSKSITVPININSSKKTTIKCVMGNGNQGAAVEAIQNAAEECYDLSLGSAGVDGVYGSATTAAVKKIQKAGKVTADGVYGPNTHNITKFYKSCLKDGVLA